MIDRRNLEVVLKSHFPIVVVETHEEPRALDLLKQVTVGQGRALYTWSAAQGLRAEPGGDSGPVWSLQGSPAQADDTTAPEAALARVKETLKGAVVALLDFHPYLRDPRTVRLLREIAHDFYLRENRLVLLSHALELPPELKRLAARFELSLPDGARLNELVLEEARLWRLKQGGGNAVKADRRAMELLVQNLRGLTVSDAKRLIRNAIHDDGAITASDLPEVMKAKYELVSEGGVLSFEYDTATFAEVGGFSRLKGWLERRQRAFLAAAGGLDTPKGILLLGVQGGGKSLAAKAVAGAWQVPLLRLDFGALYNKYIGETEKNLRESLKAAEVMAPCVLWIDEIEKGVAVTDSDSGTAHRVLGALLTWMAEKKARVFVVATANSIAALPPELVRKGRLDEIFFVDLPAPEARVAILAAHLRKRGLEREGLDLEKAARQSDGFSGAELEQAVVSAWYAAHAAETPLTTEHLLEEIARTRPLSVVMAEQIGALRAWASQRTVPVD